MVHNTRGNITMNQESEMIRRLFTRRAEYLYLIQIASTNTRVADRDQDHSLLEPKGVEDRNTKGVSVIFPL